MTGTKSRGLNVATVLKPSFWYRELDAVDSRQVCGLWTVIQRMAGEIGWLAMMLRMIRKERMMQGSSLS
jgi:hypothetical protein